MTIAQALASQLETEGFGVVGQSIHLSKLPDAVTDPIDNWVVQASGGEVPENGSLGRQYRIHSLTLQHWQDTAADLQTADETVQAFFAATLALSGHTVVRHHARPMEDRLDEDHPSTYHGVWRIHITTLTEG